jgi:hypothetical protein
MITYEMLLDWVAPDESFGRDETINYISRRKIQTKPQDISAVMAAKFAKKQTFTEQFLVLLLDSNHKSRQHILQGDPSSGKSTELRKIGRELQALVSDPLTPYNYLVHHCSIQNYNGEGADIQSSDDLWDLIMECHESDFMKKSNISFDEFIKLHRGKAKPILLIDTLDMLTYGLRKEKLESVAAAWIDLIHRLDRERVHVLWTVRPVEFKLLKGGHNALPFHIHQLPELAYRDTRTKVSACLDHHDFIPQTDSIVFTEILSSFTQLFPVVARYLSIEERTYANRVTSRELLKKLDGICSVSVDDKIDFGLDPLRWALTSCQMFTDVVYDVLKLQILINIQQHDQRFRSKTIDDLALMWEKSVERPLLKHAARENKSFSNRFFLQLNGSRDEFLKAAVVAGESSKYGLGLFSHNSIKGEVSFIHQLFTENAVYQAAQSSGQISELSGSLISIPTFKLKYYSSIGPVFDHLEEDEINLFKRWFLPFFSYNRSLQELEQNSIEKYWTENHGGINLKVYADKIKARIHRVTEKRIAKYLDEKKKLSPDKQAILDAHSGFAKSPLLVNGPAGTGKTYMAMPFIVDRVRQRAHHVVDSIVSFVTLSKNLSRTFEEEFNELFLSGSEDDLPLPAKLNSRSVDELLYQVAVALGQTSQTETHYIQRILTETSFVNGISSDRSHNGPRWPAYALWQEFQDFFFNHEGKLVSSAEEYWNLIRANRRQHKSMFYGDEKGATVFYKLCKKLGFTNPRLYRTRDTIARELVDGVIAQLDGQNSEIIDRMELILDSIEFLRSDVLIIDEVQDLDHHVLRLCLVLHRGSVGDVAILGDNEQTLDLKEFDWSEVLQRLHSGFFPVSDQLTFGKSDRRDKLHLMRWKEVNFESLIGDIRQLKKVQRSIKPIVIFNRNSFAKSVYPFAPKETGTSAIEPGNIPQQQLIERINNIQAGDIKSGVFWKRGGLDAVEVMDLLRRWALIPKVIAVVFPSEEVESYFQRKCSEEKIRIETWHPRSIKGLEADVVIAFSPWSISQSKLSFVSGTMWEEICHNVKRSEENQDLLEKLAGQRLRHANVMLSRPKFTLLVVDLVENFHSGDGSEQLSEEDAIRLPLVHTIEPDINSPVFINGVNEEIEVTFEYPLGLGENNTGSADMNDDDLLSQLKWLGSLISAKKALKQIINLSARIFNLVQGSPHSEFRNERKLLPKVEFHIMPIHVINAFGELMYEGNSESSQTLTSSDVSEIATGEPTWVKLLELFLFHSDYRTHDTSSYTSSHLEDAKEFIELQEAINACSAAVQLDVDGSRVYATYPLDVKEKISKTFENFFNYLSTFKGPLERKADANNTIENFITSEIFQNHHQNDVVQEWKDVARKVDLFNTKLKTEDLKGKDLDDFDNLLKILCLFKAEWYDHLFASEGGFKNNSEKGSAQEKLLVSRGYTNNEKAEKGKILPYSKLKSAKMGIDVSDSDANAYNKFWVDGIEFLQTDQVEAEFLDSLNRKFVQMLQKQEKKSTSVEQIEFLLRLIVLTSQQSDLSVFKFLELLWNLQRFAHPEHTNLDKETTIQALLKNNGPTFTFQDVLNKFIALPSSRFEVAENLLGSNAFELSSSLLDNLTSIDRRFAPLALDEIYRIAMFRLNLESALEKPTLKGNASLDKLWEAANITIEPSELMTSKTGKRFKSYRESASTLQEIFSEYSSELRSDIKNIFALLKPTITKMLNESKTIAPEVVYHLYSVHKCVTSTLRIGQGTYTLRLFSFEFDDILDKKLFKGWNGQEITDFMKFFSGESPIEEKLNSEFFTGGKSTDPWNLDLSYALRDHAKENKLNIDKIRFVETTLPSSGVYNFAKSQFSLPDEEILLRYNVSLTEADYWKTQYSAGPQRQDRANQCNPISQYYIRQIIQRHSGNPEWWDSKFTIMDDVSGDSTKQDFLAQQAIAFGSQEKIVSLPLSRYFAIVRFSQFLRSKLPDLWSLGDAQKERLDKVLSTKNLLKTFILSHNNISKSGNMTSFSDVKLDFVNSMIDQLKPIGAVSEGFSLASGLFAKDERYRTILGEESHQEILNKENYGLLKALKEMCTRLDSIKKKKGSADLRELAETLICPSDSLSIDSLESIEPSRNWTN